MICVYPDGTTEENKNSCREGQGSLPPCAPFAVPFVAHQKQNPAYYSKKDALENGTLYPDLNLPFHLKVDPGKVEDTMLNQLRALDFVILELGLYLDTHPDDSEAFALFQTYVKTANEARARYVKEYGPLLQTDVAAEDSYTWGEGPWPWQYMEQEG